MFPSSGYFKGIHCPFFASGLCERPYCHFRHIRIEEKTSKPDNGPSYSSVRPYQAASQQQLSFSLQKEVASYSTLKIPESAGQAEVYQTTLANKGQEAAASINTIPSFSETPQNLPEPDVLPVTLDALPKISGLPKPRQKNSESLDKPSYIPTPKRVQLIVKGDVPSYNPTPKQAENSSKKSSSHKIEYDPVKNFAFRDKAKSEEEGDSQTDNEVALLSDSREGADDLDQADDVTTEARFSDDGDDDDCDVSKNKKTLATEDDLTDSDEDVSQKYVSKVSDEEKLQSFADLLTPSSYFTSKLTTIDRKLSTDSSKSLSAKPAEDLKHRETDGNTSLHKHYSSKHKQNSLSDKHGHSLKSTSSTSKERKKSLHPSITTSDKKASVDKSQHSLSSSSHSRVHHANGNKDGNKSSKEKSSVVKSQHLSSSSAPSQVNGNKDTSKSSKEKSTVDKSQHLSSAHFHQVNGNKDTNKSSKEKSTVLKSQHSSSSHSHVNQINKSKDIKKSSKENSTAPDVSQHSLSSSSHSCMNQDNGNKDITKSSKENSATPPNSSSRSSEKDSSHHKLLRTSSTPSSSMSRLESHKTGTSGTSHGSSSSSIIPVNGHSSLKKENGVKSSDKLPKHKHTSSKLEHSNQVKVKTKSEHNGSIISSKKHRHHSSSEKSKHIKDSNIRNSVSSIQVKQERRSSTDKIKGVEKAKERRTSGENGKSIVERRISNLTTNLFGEESDGSDSDVQIVDAPVQPPAPVYELSDSDSNLENKDEDGNVGYPDPEDFDMLSDNETFDECLRIFQETERLMAKKAAQESGSKPETAKMNEAPKVVETSENLLASLSKKRTAHTSSSQATRPVKTPSVFKPKLSPAEVMHNRIVEMQKRALLRAAKREGRESELPSKVTTSNILSAHKQRSSSMESTPSSLSTAAASLMSSQKKREAHAPNIKTPTKMTPSSSSPPTSKSVWSPHSFYNKTKMASTKSATNQPEDKKVITIASTASKSEKRKAHEPTQSNLLRPVIPAEFGAKVPTNIRQRYLNLIIDEYLKFNTEEVAFAKGQEEEQAAYSRASNKNIYLGVAVNAIKRIRTEALEFQPSSSKKQCLGLSSMAASSTSLPAQSHEATLGGSLAAKTSYTLHRSGNNVRNQPQTFSGRELYENLKKYILTEEQLRENGFPRPAEDGSSRAKIYKEVETDKMLKDNERTCKRCGKRFYVAKDGGPITVEQCVYHYANAYKKKVAGSIDSRYGCCNERVGSKGCQIAKFHVHERNKTDSLTGYMKTLPETSDSPKNYAVFSLDCEMVYTKAGLELARVTVIAPDSSVKYESLVKPDGEIIDYNTRFSGITDKDMQGVSTTLRDVQAVMLSMICDKTILIGHSLESDLQSLKLIHSTVVDTSIAFPHRLGPPYKRALRSLMVDHLQKIIQTDDSGHDSKEDAVACMQLMLYKVKTDSKRR